MRQSRYFTYIERTIDYIVFKDILYYVTSATKFGFNLSIILRFNSPRAKYDKLLMFLANIELVLLFVTKVENTLFIIANSS